MEWASTHQNNPGAKSAMLFFPLMPLLCLGSRRFVAAFKELPASMQGEELQPQSLPSDSWKKQQDFTSHQYVNLTVSQFKLAAIKSTFF